MDSSEARQFINEVLVGLWPTWKPTLAEADLFVRGLDGYTWEAARDGAEIYYNQGGDKHRRPNLNSIVKAKGKTCRDICEVETNVYVICIRHPEKRVEGQRVGVFCPVRYTPEQKLDAAEGLRRKTEDTRGGEWIVQTVKPGQGG